MVNSKQKEVWKPVVGYEGLYEVSNLGRVKSLPKYNRKTERIMKQTRNSRDGRLSVILCKSPSDHKRIPIHRIVAIAFLDNPKGYTEINHKDENPANNNVNNLEWCSRKYNMNYGKMTEMYKRNKKPVTATKGRLSITFDSIKEASEKTGVHRNNIMYAMKHGNISGGYKWEDKNADQQ